MKFYKDAELAACVVRFNDVPFLTTMSSTIQHGAIAALNNLKCAPLEFELKNVVRSYSVRGFIMSMIVVGMQFK